VSALQLQPMCNTHRVLLVRQAGVGPTGPWRALEIMATLALFQAATADPKVLAECNGEVEKIAALGCLACRKPDAFGEIVQAAQSKRPRAIKELGERWVRDAAALPPSRPGQ
jgi:hypothetical protein